MPRAFSSLRNAFALPVSLLVAGISLTTPAAAQFKTLTLERFATDAREMVGQQVEIFGDKDMATIVDPRMTLGKRAMRDPEAMKKLRELGGGSVPNPSTFPRPVNLDTYAMSPEARKWIADNRCETECVGVYFRGEVVTDRVSRGFALKLIDISKESQASGTAQKGEAAAALAAKESSGPKKELLPPGGVPSKESFEAWQAQIPRGSPDLDKTKSIWDNMVVHSQAMQRRDADMARHIVRGPERPANFETYYRSIRDTVLSDIFASKPYTDNSVNFPRVAVVIEEAPPRGAQIIAESFGDETAKDMCWRLHATVWTGPANPVQIAPFNWCYSEMRFNVPYAQVPIWGAAQKANMIAANANTGNRRTDGPAPPGSPLPTADARGGFRGTFTYNNTMVGNLLLDMGFDYRRNDGRVWFNFGY
jgi:hypothetical protein